MAIYNSRNETFNRASEKFNEALKKIKLSGKLLPLYLKLISFTGIDTTFPDLLIACIEIKISLNCQMFPFDSLIVGTNFMPIIGLISIDL